ncbi:MAG: hypothetical protein ACLRI8_04105 [Agathobacter rectalis]
MQQMLIIDGKDYQGIKEAVFKYGGVQTSLYSTIASSKTKTPYYNKQTNFTVIWVKISQIMMWL